MSKATLLQSKAADLPEPIAAEVLDFLEFLTAKSLRENQRRPENIQQLKGAFKGRLSSSDEFSALKSDEVQLEN
jgi:Protein of unknown function (DUF2281)